MRNLITCVCLFLSVMAVAQTTESARIQQVEEMKASLKVSEEARKLRVQKYLEEHKDIKKVTYLEDGSVVLLYDIVNGRPSYDAPYNKGAAETVGTDQLRTGGSLGVNLTGKDMKVGVWDGGYARDTHVEYNGRILTGDGNEFGVSNHATHVMGTILASGVNANAKGMASEAIGISYGFNNDITEMTAVATTATGNLIMSNHSYGTVTGWRNGSWNGDPSISNDEDWRFGFYTSRAKQWDDLAFAAPYYTIVKSAGNDRGDSGDGSHPADGPYDIISTYGTAKNIITVGAIQKLNGGYTSAENVQMSSFSGWGPTDDGRIKPDIVGAGVAINSAYSSSDDAYGNLQGTSMSAPNVTGSLLLLQELHARLNGGNYMRSATLKSLIFQTVNEAGTIGPDYVFGWGVLNAEAASRILIEQNNVNKVVRELTLTDGETYELSIDPAPGTEVKATIVWTDPSGTPVEPSLDPQDLMLVNDLDMRISSTSESFMPWILNPAVPGGAATTGDNFRDNAEQVVVSSADGSPLTLTINHKGALEGGSQHFSLVLTYTPDNATDRYYWVGTDGGNWNDGANWSLSSGGQVANAVPDASSDVVFDENSFNSDNAIDVSIPANVEINSLTWLASEAATFDLQNFEVAVTGDLIFANGTTNVPSGKFVFKDGPAEASRIVSNGVDLSNVEFLVESTNTAWSLVGDFSLKSIEVTSGSFSANNSALTVGSLTHTGNGTASISFENSAVEITGTLNLDPENLTFNDNGATFTLLGTNTQWTTTGMSVTGKLMVPGTASINGTGNSFADVSVPDAGSLLIMEDVSVNDMNLDPGASLLFGSEKVLTVVNDLLATGTAEKLINLTGIAENSGVITMDGHRKVCLDFLNITKLSVAGSASVTAGTNSTLTNADSWSTVSCENVLFSDFSFQYGCVNSTAQFTDLSSGAISGWSWNFGAGSSSTDQNPVTVFTQEGAVDVTLDVTDGSDTKTFTQELNIVANTLSAGNEVVDNNGVLASRDAATAYQWYRDGEIIDGATNRTYNTQGVGGIYLVATFDETCNIRSDEKLVVVTSIEDDIREQLEREVSIAPNPSEDYLDISMINDFYGEIQIVMIDLNGSVNFDTKVTKSQREFSQRISVDQKPTGLYIVQLVFENAHVLNKKVLIK
ncbi:MAG: S8 family serine peptidase [Roseivirga sp.]|nr:S8 family serine peptidase [Roseivirga sp.]